MYTALLQYTSDSLPPTPIVLENTIGNIVWTKSGTGQYTGTLVGAFPEGKTYTSYTHDMYNGTWTMVGFMRNTDDEVIISSANNCAGGTCTDFNLIVGIDSIEIRVYP